MVPGCTHWDMRGFANCMLCHRRARIKYVVTLVCFALGLQIMAGPMVHAQDFTITVDGEHVAGDVADDHSDPQADSQTHSIPGTAGGKASQVDPNLTMTFDGLDVEPVLLVTASNARGELTFTLHSNYEEWIADSEIELSRLNTSGLKIITHRLPVTPGRATVVGDLTTAQANDLSARAIVRDRSGRQDTTRPIKVSDLISAHVQMTNAILTPENDMTQKRSIRVYGGAVTIAVDQAPAEAQLAAFSAFYTVPESGRLAVQQILPPGDHKLTAALRKDEERLLDVRRTINIAGSEWFYVGLADITIGRSHADDGLIPVLDDDYDPVYAKGRLAFYLKGKIRGDTLLTAAADTGEGDIDELFRDLGARDAKALLRQIDPDEYYPVYGDNSQIRDDAPTDGKFYVRLERGPSHVMWGNFRTDFGDDRLVRRNGAFYGAHGIYESEAVTSHGAPRIRAEGFAAYSETARQTDDMAANGGSAYFLKRRHIVPASETVIVQKVVPATGRVVTETTLEPGTDYNLDTIQGLLVLSRPLPVHAASAGVISNPALRPRNRLLVSYEFVPATGDIDTIDTGANAQLWLNDHIRIGASLLAQQNDSVDDSGPATLGGLDIRFRLGEESYVNVEDAQSRRRFDHHGAIDDGSDISDPSGRAVRVKAHMDLADIGVSRVDGQLSAYLDHRTAGFSTFARFTEHETTLWGASAAVAIDDNTDINVTYDARQERHQHERHDAEISIAHQFDPHWRGSVALAYSDSKGQADAIDTRDGEGSRTDIAVRLERAFDDRATIYGFAQATLAHAKTRDRNDRIGAGFTYAFNDMANIYGEASYGTSGWLGETGFEYANGEDRTARIGYRLEGSTGNETTGDHLGGVVLAGRRSVSEALTLSTDNSLDWYDRERKIGTVYGAKLDVSDGFTLTGSLETARVWSDTGEDIDRLAIGAGLAWEKADEWSMRLRGEYRRDRDDDGSTVSEGIYLSGSAKAMLSPDWTMLGEVDAVLTSGDSDALIDGDYVEASIAAAWRPVETDRINALFRYTWLHDLPGSKQIARSGEDGQPRQRSHILSVDTTWQATKRLSLGAKYGFRIGEVETQRGSGEFIKSAAHLGIARVDWHAVKKWDLMAEGRILYLPDAGTTDYGAVAGIWRHLGDNAKLGVGYNFGRFSDDLTDLTYDDGGWFINAVGKF